MIQPVGMKPVETNAITKTAAVGPRLQPEQKPENNPDELRAKRDAIQNQITTMKGMTDAGNADAVKALEGKLDEVNDALNAVRNEPSALERLQGQTDVYESGDTKDDAPVKETTTVNTDAVDKEIKSLQKEQEQISNEADAAGKRGDEEAWNRLVKELKSVQSELQQKDNDTYRKQHASVF